MNRLCKTQLQGWLRLRDQTSVGVLQFISAQPTYWKLSFGLLCILYPALELLGESNWFIRLLVFAAVYFQVAMYVRTRMVWPMLRELLDWEKIEKLSHDPSRT